ncbi:nephrin-like, partial [Tropilaelaps mercedesae]
GNYTANTVAFLPKVEYDSKSLSCRAESNPLLSKTVLEDSTILNIHYKPQLNISLGKYMLNATSVREGTDLYLDCQIRANPAVTEVLWKFEKRPLEIDKHQGIIMANQSLALRNIRHENTGEYQCVAANSEGESESNKLLLHVHYAPFCRKKQNLIYGVSANEDAEILCSVDADPVPTNFSWTFNNTNVENFDDMAFTFNGTRSIVTYRPRYAKSYGTLYCRATNEVGTQRQPCAYHVIPASPPEPVQACVTRNRTIDSVQIMCKAGDAGGLHQTFHLEVFNFAFEYLEFNLTQSKAPIFQLSNLTPNTQYIIVMYASNTKGRSSKISDVITTATVQVERSLESTGFLTVFVKVELFLLLAGVALVVLMALAVILTLRQCWSTRDPRKSLYCNPSMINLNDKNSGSCRSLKSPAADEIQLTQVKSHRNRSTPILHEQQFIGNTSAVSRSLAENNKEQIKFDDEVLEAMLMHSRSLGGNPSLSHRKGIAQRVANLSNLQHQLEQLDKTDPALDDRREFRLLRNRHEQSKFRGSCTNCSHRSSLESSGLTQECQGRVESTPSKYGLAPLVRLNSDEGGKGGDHVKACFEETHTPLLKGCNSQCDVNRCVLTAEAEEGLIYGRESYDRPRKLKKPVNDRLIGNLI